MYSSQPFVTSIAQAPGRAFLGWPLLSRQLSRFDKQVARQDFRRHFFAQLSMNIGEERLFL